jgi:gamma-glutamylputrescine oxidase
MTELADSSASLAYADSHYARELYKTQAHDDPRPPLLGLLHSDVVIIGGGLAGLSAAASLIERGHRDVVVLEARRVGWGASGRNAGQVSAGFSLDPWDIEARVGREHARRLFDLTREAVALLRARIDGQALACAKRECGGVNAWWTPDLDEAKRQRDYMQDVLGERCELWPTEQTRDALRSERYYHALYSANVFTLQPLQYVRALATRIAQAGVRIYEGTAVHDVTLDSGRAVVRMNHGEVRARHVLCACGPYLGKLLPVVSRATVPLFTHVITTAPFGERLRDAIRVAHTVCDSRIDHDYYTPLREGRLLFGGGISIVPWSPERVARRLRRRLLAVYPQLESRLRIDSAWSGSIEYARHLMPMLGQARDGIWYSAGHGGQGLGTTALLGELFARAVVDGDDTYRLLAPFRLEWSAGALGRAAAQLSYWYYQGCDRLREWRSRSHAAPPLR